MENHKRLEVIYEDFEGIIRQETSIMKKTRMKQYFIDLIEIYGTKLKVDYAIIILYKERLLMTY